MLYAMRLPIQAVEPDLTAGIGAGLGVGNVLSQSLAGMTGGAAAAGSGQPTPPGGASPSGAAGAIPAVMTPAEAASILKVSEEDVVAAITSGDLKAKKLGNAYRISKEALEDFLKS